MINDASGRLLWAARQQLADALVAEGLELPHQPGSAKAVQILAFGPLPTLPLHRLNWSLHVALV